MFPDCCKHGLLGSVPSQFFGQPPLLDFGFGGAQNTAVYPFSSSPHLKKKKNKKQKTCHFVPLEQKFPLKKFPNHKSDFFFSQYDFEV